jgi:hypothetical protein
MRLPDWRPRLFAYVETARRQPFAHGRLDCALFVAGAVEAMTGSDPAAELRGRYTTRSEGARAIRRAGYIDHVDMVRALFPEIGKVEAGEGDIAVVPVEDDLALGIVQGSGHIFLVGEGGLMLMDLLAAKTAFRV